MRPALCLPTWQGNHPAYFFCFIINLNLVPLRFLRAWNGHSRRFSEPLFYMFTWDFWGKNVRFFHKNSFATCYYICSVSHPCKKLANISCCNLKFNNDQQQWLGKFVSCFPFVVLYSHHSQVINQHPQKILILNRQLLFFLPQAQTQATAVSRRQKCVYFFQGYWM